MLHCSVCFSNTLKMFCGWAISRHCLKPLRVEGDSLFASNRSGQGSIEVWRRNSLNNWEIDLQAGCLLENLGELDSTLIKGGNIGDYIRDSYRSYSGDTRSLHHGSGVLYGVQTDLCFTRTSLALIPPHSDKDGLASTSISCP